MKNPDGIIFSVSGLNLSNEEKSFFRETNFRLRLVQEKLQKC